MCESSILAVLSQIVCDNVVKIPRLRIVAAIKEAVWSVWFLFFFSSRRRHTRCSRDWSSDVCSSDLSGLTKLTDDGLGGREYDDGPPAWSPDGRMIAFVRSRTHPPPHVDSPPVEEI